MHWRERLAPSTVMGVHYVYVHFCSFWTHTHFITNKQLFVTVTILHVLHYVTCFWCTQRMNKVDIWPTHRFPLPPCALALAPTLRSPQLQIPGADHDFNLSKNSCNWQKSAVNASSSGDFVVRLPQSLLLDSTEDKTPHGLHVQPCLPHSWSSAASIL